MLTVLRRGDGAFLRRNHRRQSRCSSRNNFEGTGEQGRDKVTLITSAGISDLGAWWKQLLAESTGLGGWGLILLIRNPWVDQEIYAAIFIRQTGKSLGLCQDAAVDALKPGRQQYAFDQTLPARSGVFRWKLPAVAGSIIGINALTSQMWGEIATRQLTSGMKRQVHSRTPILLTMVVSTRRMQRC